ncbi:MAG: alpha-glucan family phosphorylase [Chloroflexota bacterium]
MKLIGKLSVFPKLPHNISRLEELAYNLWWSWEPDAQALFEHISPALWEATNHNPVKFLRQVEQEHLDHVATDELFLRNYQRVMTSFDAYMGASDTWYKSQFPANTERTIAYFSAEFGLHEALPIYSGGLGILSGDHCKAASDLDLPFVGVGFLYPQGYFTQQIDPDGRQQAAYEKIDFAEVPAQPALDPSGKPILINVDLPGRTVYAKLWCIQVGRIPIYLMDTDVERNAPQDRELSARLYGGDREMRISQEVVLGIGGVRALRALNIAPKVWHMNEGHSAFLGLERIRELVQASHLSFDEAVEAVRSDTLFTTHTPVPAGNDAFAFELVEKFFWQFWGQLGIDRDRFINFAKQDLAWGTEYSMTVLALRLSAYHNGVSKLHGHVSRDMWQFLWPETPPIHVPIDHVTNGIHVKTWLAPELRELYTKALGPNWLNEVDSAETWNQIGQLPNAELWSVHQARKERMIHFARERVALQFIRHGEGPRRVASTADLLDPGALTLGFARRFATYKRATLLFRDEERLRALLNNPDCPVQIIFSGKAHPADEPGKGLIQHIYHLSQRPDFWGKILFVENYDMNIARHLISGVDVWLNNPRRPHEASGTSGQKAAASGVPNFSVLDGWWVEGYSGEGANANGWAIGEERPFKDEETQDEADAIDLYSKLEDEIIPLFYDRDGDGIPQRWVEKMKNSIRTCGPQFSMARMVKEYTHKFYVPAGESGQLYQDNHFEVSKEMARWKSTIRASWHAIHLESVHPESFQLEVGSSLELGVKVWSNSVPQEEIALEIVAGVQDESGSLLSAQVIPMTKAEEIGGGILYRGAFQPKRSGQMAIGIRAIPSHKALIHPHEIGLNQWA